MAGWGTGRCAFPCSLGHRWQTQSLHHLPFSFRNFPLRHPYVPVRPALRQPPLGSQSLGPRRSEQPRWEEEDALPRCQGADNCAGRKPANPIYYYYYYYYYNYFNFFLVTFLCFMNSGRDSGPPPSGTRCRLLPAHRPGTDPTTALLHFCVRSC